MQGKAHREGIARHTRKAKQRTQARQSKAHREGKEYSQVKTHREGKENKAHRKFKEGSQAGHGKARQIKTNRRVKARHLGKTEQGKSRR
jgi:hypothetical protein